MRKKIEGGQTQNYEAIEKEIQHLEKKVHFLMEKHYTKHHHALYDVWGCRGLDWYVGDEA